jgi:RNA polymerase sigma-70 factor (ECF subfamily)
MAQSRARPATDFEALVRDSERAVLRYLLARTRSFTEATELAQETFVRAYCALRDGAQVEHPIAWLMAIARNVFLEAARNHRYEHQLQERMARMMGMQWSSPWHEQMEQRLIVASALEGLPPELREPVTLHYFGGLSLAEVAGHLEITAGAVKTRLWRARQALRGELEVLVSDAERRSAVFKVPRDLAARAKLLAERPPVYDSVTMSLQVGGTRWGTQPLFGPLFSGEWLSLADLGIVVEKMHAARVVGERPLANKLEFWPMFELFYHPDSVQVWSFLRSAEVGTQGFQESEEGRLVITDGWQLGRNDDAPNLLAHFKQAGLRHVWFTLAGLRETHDELCERPGAFDAIVKAMTRCRDAGIETGANIVVSARSAKEIRPLAELVLALGAEHFIPTYVMVWDKAWPQFEAIRPEPGELEGLPPSGMDVNWGYRDFWADPAAFTEAVLTRRAIDGASERDTRTDKPTGRSLPLWVASNLDLVIKDHHGSGSSEAVANLGEVTPEDLYQALVEVSWPPDPPPDALLAKQFGDQDGRKVHMGWSWIRRKWIECWQAEHGIPWVPFPW